MTNKENNMQNTITMTPSQLLEALTKTLIPSHLATLIVSPPGTGKTDIVNQAAKQLLANIIHFFPAVSDPTDPKGLPYFYQEDGKPRADFVPYGDTRRLIEAKALTLAFLDDLGQATPSVQGSFMQWILARRMNGYELSPNVVFIAATNRREDKSGVTGILEAVKSRFNTIIHLRTDPKEWAQWAIANGMPLDLVAFIRLNPKMLHDFKPSPDMVNTPCPRTVANVGKLVNAGMPRGLEYALISGAAGEVFASEFLGFLKIKNQLPNPDIILMNPEKAEVPTDPSCLYVICGMLTERANEQNIGNINRYADRIPADFSVLLFKDIAIQKPELQRTQGFIEWGIKHQNVTI